MGREYKIKYQQQETFTHSQRSLLLSYIVKSSPDISRLKFSRIENEDIVYGFTFKQAPTDKWECDVYLYLRTECALIVFNTGTVEQIELFKSYIRTLFLEAGMSADIEEC